MPAHDQNPPFVSMLVADRWELGCVRNASFPTTNSLVFQSPLGMDQRFFDSLNSKGYMPFARWTLILLDTALKEMGRYTWNQTRVAQIGFPALENGVTRVLTFSVKFNVTGVTQANPETRAAATPYVSPARTRDVTGCIFQMKIDGLVGLGFSVSKIGAFNVGGAIEDLVLTVSPEASANPFRDWLRNGNPPKSGVLLCMDFALRTFFRVRFTGLRVRTIAPALTTYSSNPATVHLMYSGIGFEVDL